MFSFAMVLQMAAGAAGSVNDRASSLEGSDHRELMRGVARGDEQSCRELVERLIDRVHRLASYMTGARHDVDDLVQVVLLKIIDGAHTFRGESSIEAWADRVAVRVIYKHLKKHARRDELYSTYFMEDPPSAPLEENMYRQQLYQRLTNHLQGIPLERRTAFLLHHLHGYSIAEISTMTDSPINTVRDRLRVGRKEIRRKLVVDPAFKDWVEERSI